MTAVLGPYRFDDVTYDEVNDVLYLGAGGVGEETDDIAVFMTDPDGGEVVGAILVGPRRALDEAGRLRVTLPDGTLADAAPALAAACS